MIENLNLPPAAPKPVNPQLNPNTTDPTATQNPDLLTSTPPGEEKHYFNPFERIKVYLTLPKIVTMALTLQVLNGTYKSIKFILVEYPLLEEQLAAHQITQDQINAFASTAIIILITTVISMIFALRISILKSKAAKRINAFIGIAIFLATTWLHTYLSTHGSADFITNIFFSILDTIKSIF